MVQALQHQEIVFSIMIHMDLKTLMGFVYSNCVNHDKLKNVFIDFIIPSMEFMISLGVI
jgi:hypothetical protein